MKEFSLYNTGVLKTCYKSKILLDKSFHYITAVLPVLYLLRLARPRVQSKVPKIYKINIEL